MNWIKNFVKYCRAQGSVTGGDLWFSHVSSFVWSYVSEINHSCHVAGNAGGSFLYQRLRSIQAGPFVAVLMHVVYIHQPWCMLWFLVVFCLCWPLLIIWLYKSQSRVLKGHPGSLKRGYLCNFGAADICSVTLIGSGKGMDVAKCFLIS